MNDMVTIPDSFAIKTEVFEGPLELLLDLVEKRKLLINDISLAEVTDEYMRTVSHMQEVSLQNTTHFVALAATLLLIKSKSLLPVLELTEEEESNIEDLESRLKLYRIYRDAGRTFFEKFGAQTMYERQFKNTKSPLFVPDKYTTLSELRSAIHRVLEDLPTVDVKPKVRVRKVISLEEMIDKLHNRINRQMKMLFSEFLEDSTERTTIIVGFLAVLESVKQGSVLVAQVSQFEEIEIELETANVPQYR